MFRSLRYVLFGGFLLSAASPNQFAQQAQPSPPQGKSQIRVFFIASATTASTGTPSLSEMSATLDKQPIQITSLRAAKEDKLLFALLIDLSTSEAPRSAMIKDAALRLFEGLSAEGNQGYLVGFDVAPTMSKRPLQLSEFRSELDREKFGGGTALYDTIRKTCTQILSKAGNPQFPRRAIVVISDGEDTQGGAKPRDAIETAEKEGVAIFSLATSPLRDRGELFLKVASRATGGLEITPTKMVDGVKILLSAINQQFAIDLESPVTPDLPPISQPLITRVSRFWFGFEIISQPPSRLCKCGKRFVLSTFA
jgi:Mg-chelatase subunit ChlD